MLSRSVWLEIYSIAVLGCIVASSYLVFKASGDENLRLNNLANVLIYASGLMTVRGPHCLRGCREPPACRQHAANHLLVSTLWAVTVRSRWSSAPRVGRGRAGGCDARARLGP